MKIEIFHFTQGRIFTQVKIASNFAEKIPDNLVRLEEWEVEFESGGQNDRIEMLQALAVLENERIGARVHHRRFLDEVGRQRTERARLTRRRWVLMEQVDAIRVMRNLKSDIRA